MVVSLPGMIAQSSLDPESVGLLKDYVNELLLYAVHTSIPPYEVTEVRPQVDGERKGSSLPGV